MESVRGWAEFGDLRGVVVSAGRAGVGGERVFGAAVLRAGLVEAQWGVLWAPHQDLWHRTALRQPGTSAALVQTQTVHLVQTQTVHVEGRLGFRESGR